MGHVHRRLCPCRVRRLLSTFSPDGESATIRTAPHHPFPNSASPHAAPRTLSQQRLVFLSLHSESPERQQDGIAFGADELAVLRSGFDVTCLRASHVAESIAALAIYSPPIQNGKHGI